MSALQYVVTTLELVVGWLLLVGGTRRCQVELNHFAIHNRVFKSKTLNRNFVEVTSTLLFIQDFAGYLLDHIGIGHHKANEFCGPHDPDWIFLNALGLKPGMTRQQCWHWLGHTCFSPRFHWMFLKARCRANFLSPNRYRRAMAIIWAGIVIGVTSWHQAWVVVGLAWIFPLTILYHISALLQFTSEHKWYAPLRPDETPAIRHARLSHARYSMSAFPLQNEHQGGAQHTLAVMKWVAITLLVDLPARVACLVGDLPVHHKHHGNPGAKDWAMAIYTPEGEKNKLYSPAYWGLIAAFDAVFDHIASLPPEESRPADK